MAATQSIIDPFAAMPHEVQSSFLRGELQRRGLGMGDAAKLEWGYRTFAVPHEMLRVEIKRLVALSSPEWYSEGAMHRPTVLRSYYESLIKPIIHAHHESEEQLWFPEISKHLAVAPKMSADHATLMELLDSISSRIADLERSVGSDNAVMKERAEALHEVTTRLAGMFDEHLLEEEQLAAQFMQHLDEAWERRMIERQVAFARRNHSSEVVSMEFAAILLAMEKWGYVGAVT